MTEKEELARLLWESGALRLGEGETPLCWEPEAALEEEKVRDALLDALETMARDHYASAQAVLGGPWAGLLARRLGLPLAPAELTEYALRKGAGFTGPGGHRRADGDPACGYWWLRSPGYVQVDAAYVNGRGTLVEGSVIWEEACVRPAFWLDLGAAGNN